jgi:redox-sensing transcriptional repressor
VKVRAQRSMCGLFGCSECELLHLQRCPGCLAGNLARHRRGESTCIAYECVREQKVDSCLDCEKSDCPMSDGALPFCVLLDTSEGGRTDWQEKLTSLLRHRNRHLRTGNRPTPPACIARIRWYLAALEEMLRHGTTSVTSYDLGRVVGVKSALVRRDLSSLGQFGTPSLGYDVSQLRSSLMNAIGHTAVAYWVGARALSALPQIVGHFVTAGCPLAGIFDYSDEYVGEGLFGMTMRPLQELATAVAADGITIATLAVPPTAAQQTLDTIVQAGIGKVLSMASVPLASPPNIVVQQGDLPSQLFALLARTRR